MRTAKMPSPGSPRRTLRCSTATASLLLLAYAGYASLLWSNQTPVTDAISIAKQATQSSPPPVIKVQSSLVLVDVITQDPKNGLPNRDLQKEDFRVFDNRQEVPLAIFDTGVRFQTRPIVVWLTVICNEKGKIGGSREFVGNAVLFRPALEHMDSKDTIGVAHWCDNGDAKLDLPPTRDRDKPFATLEEVIKPIDFAVSRASNLVGENTFRKMVRMIIQDAERRNPRPLPVIVFLDGDHTGQPRAELNELVDDLLETSGMVFGIKRSDVPDVHLHNGEIAEILHYMADNTGGQYFAAAPAGFAAALDAILVQLHFRYELGFTPIAIDGKRHELRVELTKDAREKYKNPRLRFRPEYIPLRDPPAWSQ